MLAPGPRVLVALAIALFLDLPFPVTSAAGPPAAPGIEVFFSPHGGAADAIVREIGNAKREVLVQAYSFTSKPVAEALLGAHRRGVKVTVILDKGKLTAKYSAATFLNNVGIPLFVDDKHNDAHNKIILVDRSVLLTGSFNFTRAAEESNAENLLVIRGLPELVRRYLDNFEEHLGHSERFDGEDR